MPASDTPSGYQYHPTGYLWRVLPAEAFSELPEAVEIHGERLARKTEYHMTIIHARGVAETISEMKGLSAEEAERGIRNLLTECARERGVDFAGFTGDLRFAVSPSRKSVAARCRAAGIEGFFKRIESAYGYLPPLQPTHVSLYTLGREAVGIDTIEEMESFEKLDLPEVERALSAARIG